MSREELLALRHEAVSLKPRVEELKSREIEGKWDKRDFMALTAMFIEDAWTPMHAWATSHDMALPYSTTAHPGEFLPAPADWLNKEKYPEDILKQIDSALRNFWNANLKQWERQKEQDLSLDGESGDFSDTLMRDHYQWLKRMITEDRERRNHPIKDGGPAAHLASGFGTATNVNINFLQVIPHVFRQERRKFIGGQEALAIFQGSRRLILTMAAMGINGLVNLDFLLGKPTTEHSGLDRNNYDPSKFILVESGEDDNKKVSLGIKPEIMRDLRETTREREMTTGCPALVANGPDKQNVVIAHNEWITEIAKMHYFPFLESMKRKAALFK